LFLLIPLTFLLFVGMLSELYKFIDEIYFYLFEYFTIIRIAKPIELAHWFSQFRIKHVFYAILSSKSKKSYLPGMSFEIRAQRLPCYACSLTSNVSSSLDHFSFLIPTLRWLWYRSRHCLPLRPSIP